ncbi:MAG: hypothetical protein EON52_09555, partial [Actinomycetales bacterium]
MAPHSTTPPRTSRVRRLLAPVSALVLAGALVSAASPAQADDSLEDQVAAIIGSVLRGDPLRVVVTRTSADGRPTFDTTVVSTLEAATALVRTAL